MFYDVLIFVLIEFKIVVFRVIFPKSFPPENNSIYGAYMVGEINIGAIVGISAKRSFVSSKRLSFVLWYIFIINLVY